MKRLIRKYHSLRNKKLDERRTTDKLKPKMFLFFEFFVFCQINGAVGRIDHHFLFITIPLSILFLFKYSFMRYEKVMRRIYKMEVKKKKEERFEKYGDENDDSTSYVVFND